MSTPSTRNHDPILTPEQAAAHVNVKPRWIYEKVQARVIPHSRVGKFIRIRQSDLDAYVESMRVEAVPNSGPNVRTNPDLPNRAQAAQRRKAAGGR